MSCQHRFMPKRCSTSNKARKGQRPSVATFLAIILAYFIILAGILHSMANSGRCQDASASGCMNNWSLFNCFWFLVVTFTTIGFGDIVPEVSHGISLVRFWCFFLVALTGFGLVMALIETQQAAFYRKAAKVVQTARTVRKSLRTASGQIRSLSATSPGHRSSSRWSLAATPVHVQQQPCDEDAVTKQQIPQPPNSSSNRIAPVDMAFKAVRADE